MCDTVSHFAEQMIAKQVPMVGRASSASRAGGREPTQPGCSIWRDLEAVLLRAKHCPRILKITWKNLKIYIYICTHNIYRIYCLYLQYDILYFLKYIYIYYIQYIYILCKFILFIVYILSIIHIVYIIYYIFNIYLFCIQYMIYTKIASQVIFQNSRC